MICEGGYLNTCNGDSVGQIIANIDGKFTLVSVTLWGKGCGSPNSPTVCSDISLPSTMKFINQIN